MIVMMMRRCSTRVASLATRFVAKSGRCNSVLINNNRCLSNRSVGRVTRQQQESSGKNEVRMLSMLLAASSVCLLSSWPMINGDENIPEAKAILASDKSPTDRFQIFSRVLGEGAFGTVRLGLDLHTGKKVAIKTIYKNAQGFSFDTKNEIKAMKEILDHGGHENLLSLVDVIEKPHVLMIVTELVSGGEMFDRLMAKGCFSEQDVAKMAKSLANGLHFLHSRCEIAHCDLKPENLLFSNLDEASSLKIVDFGCARRFKSKKRLTASDVGTLGTTVYWSPENFTWSSQREEREIFGPQSDMFSVGIILFICLFGSHPFDPQGNLEEYEIAERIQKNDWKFPGNGPEISASAKQLITSLLSADPSQRPTSRDLLYHPWVQGKTAPSTVIQGSSDRLETYQQARKHLQNGLLAAMVQQALRDQNFDSDSLILRVEETNSKDFKSVLQRTFNFFDKEGKGVVTMTDFCETVENMGGDPNVIAEVSSISKPDGANFQDFVELLADVPRKLFQPGDTIINQGEEPDKFYFVLSGKVDVFVQYKDKEIQTDSIGPGHFFGEEGLMKNKPRSATIRCAAGEPVEVLVLDKQAFAALQWGTTGESLNHLVGSRILNRIFALIQKSPESQQLSLSNNQTLFEKGTDGDDVFVVNSGVMDIYSSRTSRPVKRLSVGAMIGETSSLTGKPRNASAVCSSEQGCLLSRLSKTQFMELLSGVESGADTIRLHKDISFKVTAGEVSQ